MSYCTYHNPLLFSFVLPLVWVNCSSHIFQMKPLLHELNVRWTATTSPMPPCWGPKKETRMLEGMNQVKFDIISGEPPQKKSLGETMGIWYFCQCYHMLWLEKDLQMIFRFYEVFYLLYTIYFFFPSSGSFLTKTYDPCDTWQSWALEYLGP